jgi:type VI secretion system secreted protein Hcp
MRASLALIGALGALLLTAGQATAAAVDYFLQIDGVRGASTTRPGAIELSSFQWGVGRGISSPTGGVTDRASSAPSVSEIVITKQTDSASPLLMRACANGAHFPTATLFMRKAGGEQEEFLVYKLTDVLISSYQSGGHGHGDNPTESLTIHFAKIEVVVNPPGGGAGGPATITRATGATTANPWAPH